MLAQHIARCVRVPDSWPTARLCWACLRRANAPVWKTDSRPRSILTASRLRTRNFSTPGAQPAPSKASGAISFVGSGLLPEGWRLKPAKGKNFLPGRVLPAFCQPSARTKLGSRSATASGLCSALADTRGLRLGVVNSWPSAVCRKASSKHVRLLQLQPQPATRHPGASSPQSPNSLANVA